MLAVASRLWGLQVQWMSSAELAVGPGPPNCPSGRERSPLGGGVISREGLVREVRRLTRSAPFGAKVNDSSRGTHLRPAGFAGHLRFGPSLGQRAVHESGPGTTPPAPAATALARGCERTDVSTARQWIASLGDEVSPVDLDKTRA